MDLSKLISKIEEIPFEKWKRERTVCNWNNYTTKINKAQIKIGILYPQHYLDDAEIKLNIYSEKNELLIKDFYNQEIGKIAMKLEKIHDEKSRQESYKDNLEKRKKLESFLNSI